MTDRPTSGPARRKDGKWVAQQGSPTPSKRKGKWIHIAAARKGHCPVCRETIDPGEWISKFVPQGRAWRHRRCIGKTSADAPWSTSNTAPETLVDRLMERQDKHTFTGFCEVCQVQLWQGESGLCRSCRRDRYSRRWHDADED